jgi:hypothetical protein
MGKMKGIKERTREDNNVLRGDVTGYYRNFVQVCQREDAPLG